MPDGIDFEARLAAIVASSDDAIISKDLGGYVTSWNTAAERMFGYTAEEAVGKHITLIIPKDRYPEEDYVLTELRAGHRIDHYETIRQRKDGTTFEVSLTVSPIRRRDGTIIGISKIARDITAARSFERQAFRLAAIVTSSEDAIVSKDLNGVIISWNEAAERLFGFTAEEAIGRSITIVVPEDRLDEEAQVIARVRAGLSVEHFETIRQRKDGTLIDISLTVSPIRDARGRVVGASKIARDITEQRRLRAMAAEASRLQDEFLSVLSHEMRTPLNTVLGYAQMFRRDDSRMTGTMRARAVEALERNAVALARLLADILDTSRIVAGKLSLVLEPCAVEPLVAGVADTLRRTSSRKGVTVSVDVDSILTVTGDADRLRQVLWNLLDNAIKFTPAGGQVTVHGREHSGSTIISVRDSGIGISREHLPYVFDRFWQGHTGASRAFGGLGIGLALSCAIVELHGGTITAQSAGAGQGSLFTVTLPATGDVPDGAGSLDGDVKSTT